MQTGWEDSGAGGERRAAAEGRKRALGAAPRHNLPSIFSPLSHSRRTPKYHLRGGARHFLPSASAMATAEGGFSKVKILENGIMCWECIVAAVFGADVASPRTRTALHKRAS